MSPIPKVDGHPFGDTQTDGGAAEGWFKIGKIVRAISVIFVESMIGMTGCTLRIY